MVEASCFILEKDIPFCLLIEYKATENVECLHKKEEIVSLLECAKFRGSSVIVGFMGLMSSCHRAIVSLKLFFVGNSWFRTFFL